MAVQIGGGNDDVAMKHLPLMLEGSARAWLNQLAPGSIFSSEDLAQVFIKTFEGTCKRPAGLSELQYCVQKPNETLRDYIQRWTTLHYTVENVSEHQAVCAFKEAVWYRQTHVEIWLLQTIDFELDDRNRHSVCEWQRRGQTQKW